MNIYNLNLKYLRNGNIRESSRIASSKRGRKRGEISRKLRNFTSISRKVGDQIYSNHFTTIDQCVLDCLQQWLLSPSLMIRCSQQKRVSFKFKNRNRRPFSTTFLSNLNVALKDEDNNVITAPKNVTTKNVRKGHVDSVLFSKPSYNAVGEPYNAASAIATRKQDNQAIAAAGHEKLFAPAK